MRRLHPEKPGDGSDNGVDGDMTDLAPARPEGTRAIT